MKSLRTIPGMDFADPIPRRYQGVIRCDAGPLQGLEQVNRNLILAEVLIKAGYSLQWVIRTGHPKAVELIARAGIIPAVLAQGATLEEDVQFTGHLAQGAHLVVLDGPFVDDAYEKSLIRGSRAVLLKVDDLGTRNTVADILVNSANKAHFRETPMSPETIPLLGPAYALVADEFVASRPEFSWTAPNVGRVMVWVEGPALPCGLHGAGGGVLERISAWLWEVPGEFETMLICETAGEESEALASVVAQRSGQRVVVAPRTMVPLILSCDLGITTAGNTPFHFACLGRPFVTLALSAEHELRARDLEETDVAPSLGSLETLTAQRFVEVVSPMLLDREYRRSRAQEVHSLLDGEGKFRVVRTIQECVKKRFRT